MSEKQVSFNLQNNKIINYDPNVPINKTQFLWNYKIIIIVLITIITFILILLN